MYAIVIHCGEEMGDMFVTEDDPSERWNRRVQLFDDYDVAAQHASIWKKGSASIVRYDESKDISEMERC